MKKSFFILGLLLSVAFLNAQNAPIKSFEAQAAPAFLQSVQIEDAETLDAASNSIDCVSPKGLSATYISNCEAMLKWYAPSEVLWDNGASGNSGYQSMRSLYETNQRKIMADDFVVPAGEVWSVYEVYYGGFYKTTDKDYEPPTYIGIGFYEDGGDGLPSNGTPIFENEYLKTLSGSPAALWQTVVLPEVITLYEGRYWVSIYGTYEQYSDPDVYRYLIVCHDTDKENPWVALDESDGPEWQNVSGVNFSNMAFRIRGSFTQDEIKYNIYRDNALIAEKVSELTFIDSGFDSGVKHTWSVRAVCNDGSVTAPINTTQPPCGAGIADNPQNSFTIAPNPSSGGTIKITANSNFNRVEVINFVGQTVLSASTWGSEIELDISTLTNGVYFVSLATENGFTVQKFVKQ